MADKVDPRTGELTTANYGWIKPTVGASTDAWGGYINSDLDGIDSTVKSVSNAIPVASSTTPAMDGTAAVGTGTTFARADHIHPTDTSRAATSAIPVVATTTPVMDGTATIGASGKWADGAHVHPTDTTRAAASALASYQPLAGVTDGSNAAAGQIGEVISATVTSAVTLTSTVTANIASVVLTPGDWDVCGDIGLNVGTGAATLIQAGISPTSAALPAFSVGGSRICQLGSFASAQHIFGLRTARVNITTSTTYYLVANVTFPSGTTTAIANIFARRAR